MYYWQRLSMHGPQGLQYINYGMSIMVCPQGVFSISDFYETFFIACIYIG